jgi:tripartite-type tricarboxylate transporter receptor subunit TctC
VQKPVHALATGLMAVLLAASSAFAAFPDKSLRLVSGYAAGGASDLISRFIAEAVSPVIGQGDRKRWGEVIRAGKVGAQ